MPLAKTASLVPRWLAAGCNCHLGVAYAKNGEDAKAMRAKSGTVDDARVLTRPEYHSSNGAEIAAADTPAEPTAFIIAT